MSGRPQNQSRQIAIELGLPTYIGTRHERCGTNVRYTSGGGCVLCARVIATEQRQALRYLRSTGALDTTANDVEQMAIDNAETAAVEDETEAEARRQASFDELM